MPLGPARATGVIDCGDSGGLECRPAPEPPQGASVTDQTIDERRYRSRRGAKRRFGTALRCGVLAVALLAAGCGSDDDDAASSSDASTMPTPDATTGAQAGDDGATPVAETPAPSDEPAADPVIGGEITIG